MTKRMKFLPALVTVSLVGILFAVCIFFVSGYGDPDCEKRVQKSFQKVKGELDQIKGKAGTE